MRGGAQSHLMLDESGHAWVVKFQNNPQHLRVLANELLGTRIAEAIGLPVPRGEVVEVTPWLIDNTPDLEMRVGATRHRCRPGLQFGSEMVGGLMPSRIADYLPAEQIREVKNTSDFVGVLAFDKWTCNADGRQAVFHRKAKGHRYLATFVDQGFCFNGDAWRFVDAPLRGVYAQNDVYRKVTGWESFEPWLSRIEMMDAQLLWQIAMSIPVEWCCGEGSTIESLIERLIVRRAAVRQLIDDFRNSSRNPFPNWKASASAASHSILPRGARYRG